MNFYVMTLFPDLIGQIASSSILGRAEKSGFIHTEAVNIRDFSEDKHKHVDDYCYGGGKGMLMKAQPVYDCYNSIVTKLDENRRPRVIYMTPQGKVFNQAMARELSKEKELVFLCGHYEGIDERVIDEIVTDRISIGDYVLTGGELSSLVVMDAVSRLVPGVLKNDESAATESFNMEGLLEYPQYTRPDEWHGRKVPDILLSGDHAAVDRYRMHEMRRVTGEYRPDIYREYLKKRGIE